MNSIVGLLAIWTLVLGMAFIFRGQRGARWWWLTTWKFLGWLVHEVLAAVGSAALWAVRNGHAYFYSHWPQQTLIAYGAAILIIFLLIVCRR
jgi:hypothetical protein